MEDSLLMKDNTEGDGKAEIVMDYVMSYSLRMATDAHFKKDSKLCQYCRYMLGALLGIAITDDTNVESVKVWKEWRHIDLCVEAIVDNQNYALLIENKYYTLLRDGQLEKYKKIFDEYYDSKKWERRYRLVSCLEDKEKIKKIYDLEIGNTEKDNKTEFSALSFYDLLPNEDVYEDTESEIFNEFWLRKW